MCPDDGWLEITPSELDEMMRKAAGYSPQQHQVHHTLYILWLAGCDSPFHRGARQKVVLAPGRREEEREEGREEEREDGR